MRPITGFACDFCTKRYTGSGAKLRMRPASGLDIEGSVLDTAVLIRNPERSAGVRVMTATACVRLIRPISIRLAMAIDFCFGVSDHFET